MFLFSLSPKRSPMLEEEEKGIDTEGIANSHFLQKKTDI